MLSERMSKWKMVVKKKKSFQLTRKEKKYDESEGSSIPGVCTAPKLEHILPRAQLNRKEEKHDEQEESLIPDVCTAPKLEHILPRAQVISLYAGLNVFPKQRENKEKGKENQNKISDKKNKEKHDEPEGSLIPDVCTAPKLEDILPRAQLMSLYAGLNVFSKKRENKEKGKDNQNKISDKKKKAVANPVSERPRTFEAAVANVKYEELKCHYELAKMRFNDNPLNQLKALTAFFTSKLVVDQNKTVFSGKCLEYPLGSFPEKHRSFLHNVFSHVNNETRSQFFHKCLLALINDLKKGCPISGYKVMLQSLVRHYPDVLYDNLDLIFELIQAHIHPNKMYISTTIMWVLSQAANFNFKHGLQVWRTFMLSSIELKNYTRYSLDYLKYLFSRFQNREKDTLTIPEYLECVDRLFQFYTIPKSCLTELQSSCKLFREITSLKNADEYFLIVLEEKIPQPGSTLYRQQMVAFLYSLLREEPQACFQKWRHVYVNNLPESLLLLRLIFKDWQSIQSNEILPYKETAYTIETFYLVNQTLYKKKIQCEGLDDCNRILQKMIVRKSSPLRWLFILLPFIAMSSLVAYDISLHETFLDSYTGHVLRSAGVNQLALKARTQYTNATNWFSTNCPTFLIQTAASLEPYLVLIKNLIILFCSVMLKAVVSFGKYVAIKLPILHESIKSYYFPIIVDWSQNAWTGFLQHVEYLSAQSMYILNLVIEYLRYLLGEVAEYLQEHVFVGEYSLDHLQKAALQGLSVVQEYVSNSSAIK